MSSKHEDTFPFIIHHRIVLDTDIKGIALCSCLATQNVNTSSVARNRIVSDGDVGNDVVIARRKHLDPVESILPDLVAGNGSVIDMSPRLGGLVARWAIATTDAENHAGAAHAGGTPGPVSDQGRVISDRLVRNSGQ